MRKKVDNGGTMYEGEAKGKGGESDDEEFDGALGKICGGGECPL